MNGQSIPAARAANARYWLAAVGIIAHPMFLLIAQANSAMSAQLWTLLGWAWLPWIPALVFCVRQSSIRLWLPLFIGLVLFTIIAPTLLAFTAWTISGFAP